jgi:hypothetical protein
MALKQVRTATGVELTALSGSGFVVNSGGYITVDAGGTMTLDGDQTINGTWTAADGAIVTFDEGSETTFSGASGNQALVTFGPYVTVGVAGPSAAWSFGNNSSLSFSGASGNVATLSMGNYVTWTLNGANSTFTMTTGAFTIASGMTYSVAADCARTGADLPSGNGAYQGKRVQNGAGTSTTYNPERFDVLVLPTGLGAPVVYTLNNPPVPLDIYIACPGNPGDTIQVQDAATNIITNTYTAVDPKSLRKLVWTGSAWFSTT